jgi:probable phosphoglycerate mutase
MEQIKTLIAFRHGEYDHNTRIDLQGEAAYDALSQEVAEDIDYEMDLSDKGVRQAEILRDALAHTAFDACLSSPYLRTLSTASIVLAPHGIYFEEAPALRERNLGIFRDMPRTIFHQKYPREHRYKQEHPLDWVPRDGDPLRRVGQRVLGVLWRANSLAPNGTVAFSTHADVMVAMRSLPELGNLSEEQLKRPLTTELQNPQWIQNCQFDIYTRQDPFTGEVADDMKYFRSIAPVITENEEDLDTRYDTGWLMIAR